MKKEMTNNSIKEKRQTNTKWGHFKNLSIIQKKICNMLKRTKKSGPTLSMHNFHPSREKKTVGLHGAHSPLL